MRLGIEIPSKWEALALFSSIGDIRLEPQYGPESGGTPITIHGSNWDNIFKTIATLQVLIGKQDCLDTKV